MGSEHSSFHPRVSWPTRSLRCSRQLESSTTSRQDLLSEARWVADGDWVGLLGLKGCCVFGSFSKCLVLLGLRGCSSSGISQQFVRANLLSRTCEC